MLLRSIGRASHCIKISTTAGCCTRELTGCDQWRILLVAARSIKDGYTLSASENFFGQFPYGMGYDPTILRAAEMALTCRPATSNQQPYIQTSQPFHRLDSKHYSSSSLAHIFSTRMLSSEIRRRAFIQIVVFLAHVISVPATPSSPPPQGCCWWQGACRARRHPSCPGSILRVVVSSGQGAATPAGRSGYRARPLTQTARTVNAR